MGGDWANERMPVLLLTTTGRRTGRERTWPVGYVRDGDAYAVVASNGGLPAHPSRELPTSIDARGSDVRLWYQAGWDGRPPFEATTA